MDDFSFDIGDILSPEEAEKYLEGTESLENEQVEEPVEEEKKTTQTEEVEEPSEGVGQEEKIDETVDDAVTNKSDGSSPQKFYSSIASALKDDGIFPDFTDEELNAVESPEDFAELMEKAITARLDERMRRIDSALGNGANPDQVKMYEQTISYLTSITDEAINDEGEDGEGLRRQLIYNDLINRGFSQEKATREVDKSFKSGSDIDDAKDALEALTKFYQNGYTQLQKDAKAQADAAREARKQDAEKFRKMVLEDEFTLGETKLDKKTRQKVFDAVSKPIYKDPDSGQLLTAVQKFQKENPLEFLRQLGTWFVLTDGGKSTSGLIKEQLRAEKNKGIRELESKINSTSFNSDGSLKYVSGRGQESDTLLSDDWQIDMGNRE